MSDSIKKKIEYSLVGLISGYLVMTLIFPFAFGNLTFYFWLKDWQTLFTGLIALAVASWTVSTIKSQIEQEKILHEDILKRKSLAIRAQMPDSLSELINFARNCFDYLNQNTADMPLYPRDAINVFKNSIEFLDVDSSGAIYEMVVFYQVHNARLNGYQDLVQDGHDYIQAMQDLILLNFYFNRAFDYARNETDKIIKAKPTFREIVTAFNNLHTTENMSSLKEYPNLKGRLERRYNT